MKTSLRWLILIMLSWPYGDAHSGVPIEQTAFSRINNPDSGIILAYDWSVDTNIYQIRFSLSAQNLASMPSTKPKFSHQMLNREIEMALTKYASEALARGIKVIINKRPTRIDYSVRAAEQDTVDDSIIQLNRIAQSAEQAYLTRHYLSHFTDHLNRQFVQNDYRKYAMQSSSGLTSIVESIQALQTNKKDLYEFVSLALGWVQSIPYNDLQSRSNSNGAGYLSPLDLLLSNIGDCDSKSTLFAALLMAYNPRIQLYMVLLPEHALLAVNIPAKQSAKTILIEGRQLVLVDPTGPAGFAIGEVADDTVVAIRNRQYSALPLQ